MTFRPIARFYDPDELSLARMHVCDQFQYHLENEPGWFGTGVGNASMPRYLRIAGGIHEGGGCWSCFVLTNFTNWRKCAHTKTELHEKLSQTDNDLNLHSCSPVWSEEIEGLIMLHDTYGCV